MASYENPALVCLSKCSKIDHARLTFKTNTVRWLMQVWPTVNKVMLTKLANFKISSKINRSSSQMTEVGRSKDFPGAYIPENLTA